MIGGWTIGAWLVVVIIPALITGFSIFYYAIGDKNYEDDPGRKEDNK